MNDTDKRQVSIIDYGAGNLRSVANAITKLGQRPHITSDPNEVLAAETVILPGVGAAADTMNSLKETGMDKVIRKLVAERRPLFAVCVGMQVLLTGTEEGGWCECLNIVPGKVRKLPPGRKIPHMGWNQVKQRISHPIFDGIPDETNFYFVHSYYPELEDESIVAGTTEYGASICSVLIKDNLVATQFHPEKSGDYGLRMYDNFLKISREQKVN
jgi:glutamine amidotransferase